MRIRTAMQTLFYRKSVIGLLPMLIALGITSAFMYAQPVHAESPFMERIRTNYIVSDNADASGVELRLNYAGLRHCSTWNGARDLATYAVVKYRQKQGSDFPRPAFFAWNAVDAEIHDHCNWALGRGWGKIPTIQGRANPINIGVDDIPPHWKD